VSGNMPRRPPTCLLEVTLPCPPQLGEAAASKACADAGNRCGYLVAGRTGRSVVLLPRVKPSMRRCIVPGFLLLPESQSSGDSSSGQGIAAEFIHGDDDGLKISIVAPDNSRGEAYVAALRALLTEISSSSGRAASEISPRFPCDESAYLFVSRLLCDQHRSPGRVASEFLRTFSSRYSDASCLPDASSGARHGPVAECSSAINRLCRLVNDALTDPVLAGRAAPSTVMPWLRTSVERWVYARVGPMLWRLYESCSREEDALFVEKSQALAAVGDAALLEALEVRSAFHGAAAIKAPAGAVGRSKLGDREDAFSEYDAPSQKTCSTAAGTDEGSSPALSPCTGGENKSAVQRQEACGESVGEDGSAGDDAELGSVHSASYERVASGLLQVEAALSAGCSGGPREAVEALVKLQRGMKECAYESSGEHLSAMDDILPVFIFVLVRSSCNSPMACAKLMSQALTQDEQMGKEGRAVLLLECAARYVATHWDISPLL